MASIPESNSPVRLALVGAGRWGRVYLRTLAALDGIALVGVASANPATAALVSPGCRLFPHWRDLLAAGGFDGLIIATPPATHAEIAEAALRDGVALLVEKPLTLDLDSAEALRRLAAAAPVLVQVGHVHLASPAWRELKRRVDTLGPVRAIRAVAGNHGPYRDDAAVLWDWGPHDLSMCLDLMGVPPDRVAARVAARRRVDAGWAERLELRLGFGAVEAAITLGTDMDKTRRFEVVCARGSLVYDDLAPAKLTLDGVAVAIAADPPLSVQVQDFAAALRAGSRDRSGLDLGVAVVDLLQRCQAVMS